MMWDSAAASGRKRAAKDTHLRPWTTGACPVGSFPGCSCRYVIMSGVTGVLHSLDAVKNVQLDCVSERMRLKHRQQADVRGDRELCAMPARRFVVLKEQSPKQLEVGGQCVKKW
eukprot:1033905-Rhodomonas_salina.5